jgi:hypothetical protein
MLNVNRYGKKCFRRRQCPVSAEKKSLKGEETWRKFKLATTNDIPNEQIVDYII